MDGRRNPHPQSPRRIEARKLKAKGMTYAAIGRVMNITRQRAQQLVAPTPKVRTEAIAKIDHKCEKCGAVTRKLDWHHDDYLTNPSRFLCTSCHKTGQDKMVETKDVLLKDVSRDVMAILEREAARIARPYTRPSVIALLRVVIAKEARRIEAAETRRAAKQAAQQEQTA